MSPTSYLSKYVHHIIVDCGQNLNYNKNKYIKHNLTYNWKEIENILGKETDELKIHDQTEAWYLDQAHLVWEVIHEAGSAVESASSCKKQDLYDLCQWMCCQHDMAQYHHPSQLDQVSTLLTLLHITANFERALGNVYLAKKQPPVPFLLKDLLLTPELISLFGKVPILFTQLLVGAPKGLNLRNVVWHGFISPGELHPHLVSGFITLFASLGQLLPPDLVIPKRPKFSAFEKFQSQLSGVFPDITDNGDEVSVILEKSPYISVTNKIYWREAYKLFKYGRFGDSLVLLLPQLEHCLRVIYCSVNDCPTRLLTAESTVLYTTLDDILAPAKCTVVGEGLLMMLLDLMCSLSGPRIRDKISHGECDLSQMPQWLVNHVFCIALAVISYQDTDQEPNSLLSLLQSRTSHYRSQFHVVALLRRNIDALLQQWVEWQHCHPPPEISVDFFSCPQISTLAQLLFPQTVTVDEKVLTIVRFLKKADPPTLYRPQAEMELAASLQNVVDHVTQTAEKISVVTAARYIQWCEHSLRSRGRATCLRMWARLPDLWTALLCVVMVTALCYQALPSLPQHSKAVLRLLKSVTKSVENTVTLCDEDRNRWTEAHSLLSALSESVLQWLRENPDVIALH